MISLGKPEEIDEIIALIEACGKHMRENGIDQWDEDYPDRSDIEKDLSSETLYTLHEEGKIVGIVVLNEFQEREYSIIDWLTDEKSTNLVIHRLGVLPELQGRGFAQKLMDYSEGFAKKKQLRFNSIRHF